MKIAFSPDARQVRLPEELVVYADEQGTNEPAGDGEFAIGLAFAPVSIQKATVDGALAERAQVSEHRCVRRDYFHASVDCPRCRASSGRLVRETLGDIFFSSLRWRFDRSAPDHPHKGELHSHVLALALNHIAQGHGVRRIQLRFARVQGLSEQSMRARLEADVEIHLRLMTGMPALPHGFVEIVPEEVGAADPGVQVTDRILWQERRGDIESLGLLLEYENATEGPFTVRNYVRSGTTIAVVPPRAWGRDLRTVESEEIVFMLREIERAIHRVNRENLPEVRRLAPVIRRISSRFMNNPRIGFGDLQELCRTFLLVVDTVPLYRSGVEEDGRRASEAAALAAAILRAHEAWTVTVADHWITRRARIIAAGEGDYLSRDQP